MAFEPGKSGNPGGRPKGALNKTTDKVREMIASLIEENFEQVGKEFQELKGREKLKAMADLLPYILPRLQSTSTSIRWEDLSEDEIDQVLERLKNSNQ